MKKNNLVFYIIYSFIIIIVFAFFFWCGHIEVFRNLLNKTESNLFDLRQNIISRYKSHNDNIVILDTDDASYEYIMDNYGSWPISRRLWGEIINNISESKAKYIVIDLLFIKADKNDIEGDNYLAESVKNNKNVFLSMNFDNYSDEIRKSPVLKEELKLKIKKGNLKDNRYITYSNARTVIKNLLDSTDKIGIINVTRDEDGIIRYIPPVFKYKGDYYPHLSLLPALDMLNIKEIAFENNNIILDNKHFIPLDSTERTIINWYGKKHTYKHIPLWQTIRAIKEDNKNFLDSNFKDKIVYIGTSATSLSDVKSTPIESNLAGVEIHANFLNNVIDNNFIKRTNVHIDLTVSLLLSLLVGYCVLKMHSVIKSYIFLFLILISYGIISCILMAKFNIWISLTIPYAFVIITFLGAYCEKYLLKVKDYEQTYKLAVTDGLTQLYNHRYFQEKMIDYCNDYEKSKRIFSLIIIDIDYFKKFNDKYGHQSGDIVLKQVANILKRNSRSTDIVSRYGGEEMTIIIPDADNEIAVRIAEKICKAVEEADFILANGEKVNVTISVGVSTVGKNGEKPQEIISYSDKCLYKAKEQGRNQVVFEV